MKSLEPNTLASLPPSISRYFPSNYVFVRYGVHGEGSCFFLSVCVAKNHKNFLYVSPSEQKQIGREFRCAFANKITDAAWHEHMESRNLNTMTVAEARRKFCTATTWADEAMITFVSKELGLNIIFIDTENEKLYCGVHGQRDEPMIIVLWVERSHFEPVGVVHDVRDDATAVQFLFDPVADATIIDHVMNKYVTQCDV